MLAILPVLFFYFLAALARTKWNGSGLRHALLLSACGSGLAVLLFTEILSLFHAFSFWPLSICWSLAVLIVGSMGRWQLLPLNDLDWKGFPRDEKILILMIKFIALITLITALLGAPNSWDSLVYHLARIEHWLQNKTVAFYPCAIDRQNIYPPWGEYALANLLALKAPDTAANALQWGAMLGSLTAISLIAQELSASRKAQLFACLLAVSLPMGILQSVSTQTDYLVSFWLLSAVYFLLRLRSVPKASNILGAGIGMGLAFLTKGYAYIYIIPFFLNYLFQPFKSSAERIGPGIIMVLIALSLSAGYFQRNHQMSGSLTPQTPTLVNASHDVHTLLRNVLRAAGPHLGTPSQRLNHMFETIILSAEHALGASGNDRDITFLNRQFSVAAMNTDEDRAGNFMHFIFFALILAVMLVLPQKSGGLWPYLLSLLASFILFCWIIRWQPWISRFHLWLFLMFCAPCAVFMERLVPRAMVWASLIFFVCSMPWLFSNHYHPWTPGRRNILTSPIIPQYFAISPEKQPYFEQAAQKIKSTHCRFIGLIMGVDSWEYPVWLLLREAHPDADLRIEHVQVSNISSGLKYPLGHFTPCALLAIEENPPRIISMQGAQFNQFWFAKSKEDFILSAYVKI